MGLLRLIAIFILIYLVFRVITLYIIPPVVSWQVSRFKKRFYEEQRRQQQQGQENSSSKTKNNNQQIGEYVDFEEIKDDPKK